ncbi:DUF1801 domain-containing protein [Adhaeribacter sp. BT258]|uniref:DUF1801 domain-containing protein n=1 Tax=Adhaeribacter terrigena TaxID=2793070 RepID=A0ABS1C0S8_9BACT|nr:DUF1801 domain-containing protein [Adhaeribacter terrigena]MBK0402772.1 DUF1801 domain-containing protein [Adhaeribacter terrigena]
MPIKLTDAEKVNAYMLALEHPLKAEMEAVRQIIKAASPKIQERIKWNAPSYYYIEDLVTFNARPAKHVHLVFHHPFIVQIQSELLEGDYKDRRMTYFRNMEEVQEKAVELSGIINQLVQHLDAAAK